MTEFEKFLQRQDNALRLELMADLPQPFYGRLLRAVERYAEDRREDTTK